MALPPGGRIAVFYVFACGRFRCSGRPAGTAHVAEGAADPFVARGAIEPETARTCGDFCELPRPCADAPASPLVA